MIQVSRVNRWSNERHNLFQGNRSSINSRIYRSLRRRHLHHLSLSILSKFLDSSKHSSNNSSSSRFQFFYLSGTSRYKDSNRLLNQRPLPFRILIFLLHHRLLRHHSLPSPFNNNRSLLFSFRPNSHYLETRCSSNNSRAGKVKASPWQPVDKTRSLSSLIRWI